MYNGRYTTYTCYTRRDGSPAYIYSLYSIQRLYNIQPIHYTALYTPPLHPARASSPTASLETVQEAGFSVSRGTVTTTDFSAIGAPEIAQVRVR